MHVTCTTCVRNPESQASAAGRGSHATRLLGPSVAPHRRTSNTYHRVEARKDHAHQKSTPQHQPKAGRYTHLGARSYHTGNRLPIPCMNVYVSRDDLVPRPGSSMQPSRGKASVSRHDTCDLCPARPYHRFRLSPALGRASGLTPQTGPRDTAAACVWKPYASRQRMRTVHKYR